MPNGIQDRNYKPKVEKEEIYEESELEKLPGLSSKVIKNQEKNHRSSRETCKTDI